MRRFLRHLFGTGAVLAAIALLASFGGQLHPLGDSLAVFRVQIGLFTAFFAGLAILFGGRWAALLVLASLAAVAPALWQISGWGAQHSGAITVYQKNLSFRLTDPAPIIADLLETNPDIVTLQEVATHNLAVLEGIKPRLPTQLVCPFARVGGVAVASRWPLIEGSKTCLDGRGMAAMQVAHPDGPLWLVSIHLHWPWPYQQASQMDHIATALAEMTGPMIIGGDFNMVPWSHTHRLIAQTSASQRAGAAPNSFPRFGAFLPLPIDHIYAPGGGLTMLRPSLGSDHLGLLARVN